MGRIRQLGTGAGVRTRNPGTDSITVGRQAEAVEEGRGGRSEVGWSCCPVGETDAEPATPAGVRWAEEGLAGGHAWVLLYRSEYVVRR